MTYTEFLDKYRNQSLDYDGVDGAQCVDVAKAYMVEVLGLNRFIGNAIDYWNKPIEGFNKYPKTTGNPQPGDLVVFDYQPNGHIAICNWVDGNGWQGFEQNNPIDSPCHFQDHSNYNHVLGYLRPINQIALGNPRPVPPETKFTMNYTVFNADPNLLEQARQLMVQYSNGLVDADFTRQGTITMPVGIFTQDQQTNFVKQNNVITPFCFVFYHSGIENYAQISTAEVPGTSVILSAATSNNNNPLYVCYEFRNALCDYFGKPLPADIYTPTEEFVKQAFQDILPYVHN